MATTYPLYRKSTTSELVVKFTGPRRGYIVNTGNTNYEINDFHSDWVSHDNIYSWVPCDNPTDPQHKTPDTLELFETIKLKKSSFFITKVPNGYVMTSHSGHQLFIKDILKETL